MRPLAASATVLLVVSALQSAHTCYPQGRDQQLLLTCCKYALEASTSSHYVKTSEATAQAPVMDMWVPLPAGSMKAIPCWCCINVPSLYCVASLSTAPAVVSIITTAAPLSGTVGTVIRKRCTSMSTVHNERSTVHNEWAQTPQGRWGGS